MSKAIDPHAGKLIKINNTQIYNLDNYKLGYTTISKIKSKEKVTNYISKYATKELITLKSKKRYRYSRNLSKPMIQLSYIDIDLQEYFKDKDIVYSDKFIREDSSIELLNFQEVNIISIIGS